MKKVGTARIGVAVGVLAALWAAASCGSGPSKPKASGPAVVPAPLRLEARPGTFALGPETRIVIAEGQAEVRPVALSLRDMLKSPTGYDLGIEVSTGSAGQTPLRAGAIYLRLSDLESRLGREGYLLDVGADRILLEAAAPAGLFYGVQTLRQLLPPGIERPAPEAGAGPWTVPAVSIEDKPRFGWRGGMLDCSRHFFPKDFVKRWIDILARHKLNVFHWHLTDDQGWRIEIKKYPRLTEVGAWRVDREDKHWNAR
ncbi:MAG: family 20 glycosylhydrolase, partial [Candidatus Aminicenantes bacterium]|nr:family 20 glycosylhydrolase [Candidatus Aminicenantes bacterium]